MMSVRDTNEMIISFDDCHNYVIKANWWEDGKGVIYGPRTRFIWYSKKEAEQKYRRDNNIQHKRFSKYDFTKA